MKEKGVVFDIQKYSVHDGPGIRTIVFLKGCPLKCVWCQNPEGILCQPQLLFYPGKCKGCGSCLALSDCDATSLTDENKIKIDWEKCISCGKCVDLCLYNARELAGRFMTVQEVIDEIKKDVSFYRKSGGGLTLSGGDPLYQIDFSSEILKEAKRNFIHTAIETSGYCTEKQFEKIIDLVDLFLFDLKHINPEKHKELTGVDNRPILANLKSITERNKDLIIRIPLIPGMNDDENNIRKTAEFLKKNVNTDSIDLMPYHRLGVNKYNSIGADYKLLNLEPDNKKSIEDKAKIFSEYDFKVNIEGFIENTA